MQHAVNISRIVTVYFTTLSLSQNTQHLLESRMVSHELQNILKKAESVI
jgi:hypothetical protein